MGLPEQVNIPVEVVVPRRLDIKQYLGNRAALADCSRIVRDPLILMEPGLEPVVKVVYLHLGKYGVDLSALVHQLRRINYGAPARVGGVAAVPGSQIRVFGYMPRKTGHRDFCTTTALAWEDDEAHHAVVEAARTCEHFYRMTNPKLYEAHLRQTQNNVLAQYHLANGVFTSGIINKDNPLPYHYDTGNYAKVWSAMYVFKSPGYEGGYLAVPQYDMAFELPDHSLFMFDGQGLLHGVTPVLVGAEAVYRYSVVYYSLQMMWHCKTTAEEAADARALRTEREDRRAGFGTPQQLNDSFHLARSEARGWDRATYRSKKKSTDAGA